MSSRGDQRTKSPQRSTAGTSRERLASGPALVFVALSVFAITTLPASTRAEETSDASASTTSSSTAEVEPSQFDSICGGTLAASPSPEDTTASQKLSYCQAAASSKEGYDAGKVLFPVWTGVSVICTAQCALSFTPYALTGAGEYVCAGANALGGVTSGIVTKNVMEAFTGIASAGGAILMTKLMGAGGKVAAGAGAATGAGAAGAPAAAPAAAAPAPGAPVAAPGPDATAGVTPPADAAATTTTPPPTSGAPPPNASPANPTSAADNATKPAKSRADIGSCLAAGAAAMQAVGKFQLMSSSKESLVASLNEAKKLASEAEADDGSATTTSAGALTSGSSSNASGASSDSATSAITDTSTALTPTSSCSGSLSTGAILSCATAGDATLPPWTKTQRFANDFQKYTGMDLSQFAGQSENATSGAAAVGAALSRFSGTGGMASKLAGALADAEREAAVSGSGYQLTGSRGGGGGSSDGGEMDIAGMMAGIMGQLAPKTAGSTDAQQASKGVIAVANATRTRGPSSIAMDPTLGIFDRVSYRYLVLSKFNRVDSIAPSAGEPAPPSRSEGSK